MNLTMMSGICVVVALLALINLIRLIHTRNVFYSRADWTEPEWRSSIPEIAGNHTQVTGVLAGFSITVVVLLAALRLEGQADLTGLPEETALGLFIVSFFGYIATGIVYSLVSERKGDHEAFLFAVASFLYYFSARLCTK